MPPLPQYPRTPTQLAELARALEQRYLLLTKCDTPISRANDHSTDWLALATLIDRLCANPWSYLCAQATGGERRKMPPARELTSPNAVERYFADYFSNHGNPDDAIYCQLKYIENFVKLRRMTPGQALSQPYVEFYGWFRILWCPAEEHEYPSILTRWHRAAIRGIQANPRLHRHLYYEHADRLSRLYVQPVDNGANRTTGV